MFESRSSGLIIRSLNLIAALLMLTTPVLADSEDEAIEFRHTPLGGHLHMLQGKGGNIAVSAGPDGVFVIDDDYAELEDKLVSALAAISDKPVRFLINTHWHFDHAGTNEAMGEAGAVIIAHENVRQRLSTDQVIQAFGTPVAALKPSGWPVLTFTRDLSLHLNGERMDVMHMPAAHTDGDAIIFFRGSNLIHMGDLFFHGMYPFIDVGSGGSISGMIAGAERVHAMISDDTRIIPGHGPMASRVDLKNYIKDLKIMRSRVSALIDSGKSKEEAMAANALADLNERLGGGFLTGEHMTRLIYDSLMAERTAAR